MEVIIEAKNEAKQFANPLNDHLFCLCSAATHLSVGTGYVMLKLILRNGDQATDAELSGPSGVGLHAPV